MAHSAIQYFKLLLRGNPFEDEVKLIFYPSHLILTFAHQSQAGAGPPVVCPGGGKRTIVPCVRAWSNTQYCNRKFLILLHNFFQNIMNNGHNIILTYPQRPPALGGWWPEYRRSILFQRLEKMEGRRGRGSRSRKTFFRTHLFSSKLLHVPLKNKIFFLIWRKFYLLITFMFLANLELISILLFIIH